MTLIALTGVPGSGKSTVCNILRLMGFDCRSALSLTGSESCADGEEVDTECLGQLWKINSESNIVIESHLSQLLPVEYVIILERSPEKIMEILKFRGYPDQKISANIDSLLTGVIFYDASERLPTTRIFTVRSDNLSPYMTAVKVSSIVRDIFDRKAEKNVKKEF